ncbi:MAG: beta-galactosidase [Candidatus Omnitrophica bacterium]|nr:beta-galactosidase [Candidatus Omnitrophota bacterium]
MLVGTTFSKKQCEYMEEDWKETYSEVLEMGFGIIRLSAYWDEIQAEEGLYDFKVLDYQIRKAKEKGIPIVLCVGMKVPRWPEYFIPEWVLRNMKIAPWDNVAKSDYLREKTLAFIKETVLRYADEDSIKYWQVENEPLDRVGTHGWWIGSDFLEEEVRLVRELDDAKRLIIVTLSTHPNKVLSFLNRLTTPTYQLKKAIPLADIIGLNVYPTIGQKIWKFDLVFKTNPNERINFIKKITDRVRRSGKEVWITELQAEPWDPGILVHMKESPSLTASPGALLESFNEVRFLGIKTVLIWGVEYWIYREKRYKDSSWLNAVRSILRD